MALKTFIAGENVQKLKTKCLSQTVINKSYYMQYKEIWHRNKQDRHYYPVLTPLYFIKVGLPSATLKNGSNSSRKYLSWTD